MIITSDGRNAYGEGGRAVNWRGCKFSHDNVGYMGWIVIQTHPQMVAETERPRLSHMLYKFMTDRSRTKVIEEVYRHGYEIWGSHLFTDVSILALTNQGTVHHITFGGENAWVNPLEPGLLYVHGDRGVEYWLRARELAGEHASMVAGHLNRLYKWYAPAPNREPFNLEKYEGQHLVDEADLFTPPLALERGMMYAHLCQMLHRTSTTEPYR